MNNNIFNELAEQWWNPAGPMKSLHIINETRLQYIEHTINLDNTHILDVGCGGGILSESLARKKSIVTGIDIEYDLINLAQQHAINNKLNIEYYHTTINDLDLKSDNNFDAIMCMEVLEHVENPNEIIQKCAKLLKQDGHLFISTINKNLKAYAFGIIAAEYLLNTVPKGTHQYDKFIRPSDMKKMLSMSGLVLLDLKGIGFNPFSETSWLTTDTSINYIIHAKKY